MYYVFGFSAVKHISVQVYVTGCEGKWSKQHIDGKLWTANAEWLYTGTNCDWGACSSSTERSFAVTTFLLYITDKSER